MMRMFRGFAALPSDVLPTVAAIGNFDGVHLGHQALLKTLRNEADARGLHACAVTFFPHPLKVLDPARAPTMIQSLEDRIREFERLGVDLLVVVPFTLELAAVPAEDFISDHLLRRLGCRVLVVGADVRFGRDRQGDLEMLRRHAALGSFDLIVVPAVEADGARVSSSRIRRLIAQGEVEAAARLIGRPFTVSGEVVTGAGRGRTLGFPTANVLADAETRPRDGVYACLAEVDGDTWPAAVHHGPIPTFRSDRPVLEAHLIGFSGDLTGRRIRIRFLRYLREIRPFSDLEDLKAQIARDIVETRRIASEQTRF